MESTSETTYIEEANVYECINCGAYSQTPETIDHYSNCQPGEGKRWEEFYSIADQLNTQDLEQHKIKESLITTCPRCGRLNCQACAVPTPSKSKRKVVNKKMAESKTAQMEKQVTALQAKVKDLAMQLDDVRDSRDLWRSRSKANYKRLADAGLIDTK